AAHSAAKMIKLDKNTIVSPTPIHPGAMRYYKEKGIE
ncbi:TAXI family TRAP transporter solute-binding subunit, partial [Ochrobactrum sp. SFR4]